MIQAALNGMRTRAEHPAAPITPAELAAEAGAALAAGAACIHLHVRDKDGLETVAPEHVARVLTAIRRACPGVPVGVSTGAWIVPDPAERLRLVKAWKSLPDYASVNFHEEGAMALAQTVLDMGVGVEAGVMSSSATEILARSGLAYRCLRVLIEPQETNVSDAVTNIEQIEAILNSGLRSAADSTATPKPDRVSFEPPRLLHGYEMTAWPLIEMALTRGYDTRVGLEDVLVFSDGTVAPGNGALVAATLRIAARVAAATK